MRRQLLSSVVAVVGSIVWSFVSSAQTPGVSPSDAIVNMMVWGADLPMDADAYAPAVKAAIENHFRRSDRYRSKRARPIASRELEMVYGAQVRYERRLAAVSDDAEAPALAAAYVDRLKPCYEWEGHHDCPEHEAVFALEYQAAHPGGPFRDYLPLLAAHRWLCTAEAYEYEKRPADAARSRQAYEQTITAARESRDLLVRTAAEGLTARGRCRSQR
jgi:hypothetical protein